MAGETKTGPLQEDVTTTGRAFVRLPRLPSMTLFFIEITGGAATVSIEISDDELFFVQVASVTQSSVVQFAIPASVVATNIVANAGTVNITYRTVVLENIPSETLLIYGTDGTVTRPIVTPIESLVEGALLNQDKLAQDQIPASPTTIYTSPSTLQTVIEHIFLVNPTGSDAAVTLWHDGSADENMIMPPTIIVAGGQAIFTGKISMEPNDTLVADSDTADAITITVYGYTQINPL